MFVSDEVLARTAHYRGIHVHEALHRHVTARQDECRGHPVARAVEVCTLQVWIPSRGRESVREEASASALGQDDRMGVTDHGECGAADRVRAESWAALEVPPVRGRGADQERLMPHE